MMQTVNVSLTAPQLNKIQELIGVGRFASVSEAIREAVWNQFLKEELTENGYTPEAEESLVRSLKNPKNRGIVQFPSGIDTIDDQFQYMLEHDGV